MLDEIDGDLLTWWHAHNRLKDPQYRLNRYNEIIAQEKPEELKQMQTYALDGIRHLGRKSK
ncbi:hypothetical protein [Marinobacterium lutimaris]|uniref:Uncharacterized protein n=1 Tax=Marinobacterium lutimaris TaxID=568106 RepID=A0A1H5XST3_9GAMM|nr:hypothetical protein [Marinobacterium lutimaris]SEG14595.1 hypothetical protein SAMN05444390_1011486 [Marinobacterium lutimaris]